MSSFNSEAIREIEYFEDEEVLEIMFTSGKTYKYYAVEQKVYNDFLKADSKGRFYNERIKGYYDSVKLV